MKICITGGGTGGHLMVANSLLDAVIEQGDEAIFIGSLSGQDRKYFERNSSFSQVYFLNTTGVVNQRGFEKVKALIRVYKAFFEARKILKEHNIKATYSVGGFSAAPASFASLSRFIPLFIHEQNAVAGRLNAILRPFAKRFVSAYDSKSIIKGYPVNRAFYKDKRVRKELKTVIFLGGSQGAKAINDLALDLAKELEKRGIKIIHQAGERDLQRVKQRYEELGIDVELYGFTKDLLSLIEKADMAFSRAGASTLWELTANALPSVYIPYPYAAGDHQYYNAQFIVENSLGWCIRENEVSGKKLIKILDEPFLQEKSSALMEYSTPDVAYKMIKNLKEIIK